jgi:nickel/cobalt transporter (NicO) family protein
MLFAVTRMAVAAVLMAGLWTAAPLPVAAQPSPATEQGQPRAAWPNARPAAPAQPQAAPQATGWGSWLLDTQQKLQRDLAVAVRGMKGERAWLAALTLIGLSFLYGVFHAAGPGHGKAVISSYVVANRATLRRGVILSFLSSLAQACSAIGIVAVLALGMNAAGLQIRQTVHQLEIVSAVFVILAGLWLLFTQLQRYVTPLRASAIVAGPSGVSIPVPEAHSHDHHHHHHHHHAHEHHQHAGESCGCGHAHMPMPQDLEGRWSVREAAAIVLAVGIRPCTGAILVLVFALTQGMFWAGVASTFAMALGTAITVSALAVLAVGSRETAVRLAGSAWADRIYGAAGVAGALFLVALGGLLLYGALYQPTPF